jgi:LysM repeat protein
MQPRRSPARWLAPLALVACAAAVLSVVNGELRSAPPKAERSATTASRPSAPKTRTASEGRSSTRSKPRTYTVKAGDTLSSIAVKNGVSLERLQELNPELDSQALQTGQRVKLTP